MLRSPITLLVIVTIPIVLVIWTIPSGHGQIAKAITIAALVLIMSILLLYRQLGQK